MVDDKFDEYKHHVDHLFSFIICQSLSFNVDTLVSEFNSLYDSDINYCDRHMPREKDVAWLYPENYGTELVNRLIKPGDNSKNHFNAFASYMFMGINNVSVFLPEITKYAGEQVMGNYIDEL